MNRTPALRACLSPMAAILLTVMAANASAQSGSLYARAARQRPWQAKELSFIYQDFEPPKEYQLHDIVVVLVDENTLHLSEGEINRRKRSSNSMTLTDWIGLKSWDFRPDPQSTGDPTIAGQVNGIYRGLSELETRESLKLTVVCTVVDIRPNGLLVLEGHRSIRVNTEQWDISLGGMVRAEDIQPNNTVLSEKVAGMKLNKRELGSVRDGYRRGWFQKWFDKYQPF